MGSCNAFTYRLGAEYLLLLRPDRSTGKLSPYWWYLGPSNEQLRDASDPWLAWVRGQVAQRDPSR